MSFNSATDFPASTLNWFASANSSPRSKSFRFTSLILPQLAKLTNVNWFHDEDSNCLDFPDIDQHHIWSLRSSSCLGASIHLVEDVSHCRAVHGHLKIHRSAGLFLDLSVPSIFLSRFLHSTGGTDLDYLMTTMFGPSAHRLGSQQIRGWNTMAFQEIYNWGVEELGCAEPLCCSTDEQFSRLAQLLPDKFNVQSSNCSAFVVEPPMVSACRVEKTQFRANYRTRLSIQEQVFVITFSSPPDYTGRPYPLLQVLSRLSKHASEKRDLAFVWICASDSESISASELITRMNIDLESLTIRIVSAEDPTLSASESCFAAFRNLHALGDLFIDSSADGRRGLHNGLLSSLEFGVPAIALSGSGCDSLPGVLAVDGGYDEVVSLEVAVRKIRSTPGLSDFLSGEANSFSASRSAQMQAEKILKLLHESHNLSVAAVEAGQSVIQKAISKLLQNNCADLKNELGGQMPESCQGIIDIAASDFSWK